MPSNLLAFTGRWLVSVAELVASESKEERNSFSGAVRMETWIVQVLQMLGWFYVNRSVKDVFYSEVHVKECSLFVWNGLSELNNIEVVLLFSECVEWFRVASGQMCRPRNVSKVMELIKIWVYTKLCSSLPINSFGFEDNCFRKLNCCRWEKGSERNDVTGIWRLGLCLRKNFKVVC